MNDVATTSGTKTRIQGRLLQRQSLYTTVPQQSVLTDQVTLSQNRGTSDQAFPPPPPFSIRGKHDRIVSDAFSEIFGFFRVCASVAIIIDNPLTAAFTYNWFSFSGSKTSCLDSEFR